MNAFTAYAGYSGGRNVLTASNGSATTGNDIGYAGYTWNDERSQWHVRNREYDPYLGRFLQRDPVGHSSGSNFYEYAAGSAATLTDAAGLSPFPPSFWPPFTLPNFDNSGSNPPAKEDTGPELWGMLLAPAADPPYPFDDDPWEGIQDPLIVPGFDPSQFCKEPSWTRYWAGPPPQRLPNNPDPIDIALNRTGGRSAAAYMVPGAGGWSGLSPEAEYNSCVAACMSLKAAEIAARAAAAVALNHLPIRGLWPTLASEFGPGISVDPDQPLLVPPELLPGLPGHGTVEELFERYPGPHGHPRPTGWFRRRLRSIGKWIPFVNDAYTVFDTAKALAQALANCQGSCWELFGTGEGQGGDMIAQ